MTAKERVMEGLYERLEAIESDVKQVKQHAAYIRNFVEAMGAMDGTLAGMAAQLRSLQATVSGKYGAEVKKQEKTDLGMMEIGRMSLSEAMQWIAKQKGQIPPLTVEAHGAQGGREQSQAERSGGEDSKERSGEARSSESNSDTRKPRSQGRR